MFLNNIINYITIFGEISSLNFGNFIPGQAVKSFCYGVVFPSADRYRGAL